ncbi:hypothetical protein GPX89_34855 [Nocardia sp. ET3-3]|uniref:SRPBCC family protein n=1 Tax=Nocardia terrae TaxID=2675851 RepID=A0A7K1V8I4_9NOCA|nr:hypothetical protein [Nocardia terrae]MVU82398.1 hypothetical protein [Nocardia terrae]
MRRILFPALAAAAALAFRHRMLTWGATAEEAAADYPGDELITDPTGRSTMATTLPAPPEAVWPWLVQMGSERAGWYSWDLFDNRGRPSATQILPQWQLLREGDRIDASPDGGLFFTVAAIDRPATLVLRSDIDVSNRRSFDPRGPLPQRFADGIWAFHLTELPGGRTRLVVRTVGRSGPRLPMALFDRLLGEPAHFIMQRRQFTNLRGRVETTPAPGQSANGDRRTAVAGAAQETR